jgi:hypothetical protein
MDDKRRSTWMRGVSQNRVAINSAIASPATPIEAVARSDTAKTEGRAPLPVISRLLRKSDSPPMAAQSSRAIDIDGWVSGIIEFRNRRAFVNYNQGAALVELRPSD